MKISIQKPILISGVGLSFVLFFWQKISLSLPHLGEYSFWGLILVSAFFWFLNGNNKEDYSSPLVFHGITPEIFAQSLTQMKRLITILAQESSSSESLFLQRVEEIIKGDRPHTTIAILSNQKLHSQRLQTILETATKENNCQFTTFTLTSLNDENFSSLSLNHDLVLFMVQGDLTESEKETIEKLIKTQQKTVLIFNQSDYTLPEEKEIIKNQLQTRVKDIINPDEILLISTRDEIIKVKKYQDQQQYQEWQETSQPQCDQLIDYLVHTLSNSRENLFLATKYRQISALKKELHQQINIIRKEKALPIIEKYQWLAATATFANPVASLDLLAIAAINTQLIIDLGSIYHYKINLNQAKKISLEIAKLIIKLGIVELSVQAIASMLKTNSITYIAGGVIQSTSAAYLTRICSLSLIEYLEQQDLLTEQNNPQFDIKTITTKIKKVFQENQKQSLLNNFIQQATQKLGWQKG